MNVNECITTRRSIRKYKPDPVDHSLIESIVSMASYSPSWKILRSPVISQLMILLFLKKIADDCTPVYNSNIIQQSPMLIAVTFIKGRCGFERDGSYSTKKEDRWQMFDTGAACQTFCLAAKEKGLGTVIMGIFDEDKITELLEIPEERELAALIAVGWPDIDPEVPKRKSVDDLLQFR